jgi:hypothetical protein
MNVSLGIFSVLYGNVIVPKSGKGGDICAPGPDAVSEDEFRELLLEDVLL